MLISPESQCFTAGHEKLTVKGHFHKMGLYCIPDSICALCLSWFFFFILIYEQSQQIFLDNSPFTQLSLLLLFGLESYLELS